MEQLPQRAFLWDGPIELERGAALGFGFRDGAWDVDRCEEYA